MRSSSQGAKVSRVVDDGSIFVGEQRNLWQDAARRFRKNWLAVAGFAVILLFLLLALVGPHVAPYDFLEQNIVKAFQGASSEHILGTDDLGRDVFSRMLHGARTAALVAFFYHDYQPDHWSAGWRLVRHSRRTNRRIPDVDKRFDPGDARLVAGDLD